MTPTTLTDTLNEARREMSDKQNTDLLPCPCCRGQAKRVPKYRSDDWFIVCTVCGLQAKNKNTWNTRNTASGGMAGDAGKAESCLNLQPSPASTDEMREFFEKWHRGNGYMVPSPHPDRYIYKMWQVAYNIIPSAVLDDIRAAREDLEDMLHGAKCETKSAEDCGAGCCRVCCAKATVQRLEKYGRDI